MLFGHLSDRYGRRPVHLAGAVGAAAWIFAFFPLLDTRSTVLIMAAATGGLLCHAAMYGPQAAFISELFSKQGPLQRGLARLPDRRRPRRRPGPDHLHHLLDRFDSALPVALYVLAGLAVTIVSVWLAPETAKLDLHEEKADERRIVEDPRRLEAT